MVLLVGTLAFVAFTGCSSSSGNAGGPPGQAPESASERTAVTDFVGQTPEVPAAGGCEAFEDPMSFPEGSNTDGPSYPDREIVTSGCDREFSLRVQEYESDADASAYPHIYGASMSEDDNGSEITDTGDAPDGTTCFSSKLLDGGTQTSCLLVEGKFVLDVRAPSDVPVEDVTTAMSEFASWADLPSAQ